MATRWTGVFLATVLGLTAPVQAQYQSAGQTASEPMPFAPSEIGASFEPPPGPPMPPPDGAEVAPNSLAGDTPNAFGDGCNPAQEKATPDGNRFYFGAEYLLFYIKNNSLKNVLVTTNDSPNVAAQFGALGQSNTSVLFGGGNIRPSELNGVRATVGWAPRCFLPMEVSAFMIHGSKSLSAFTDGSVGVAGGEVVSRAIFASQLNQETASIHGFPLSFRGGDTLTSSTDLWGAEANLFATPLLCGSCNSCVAFDVLVGVRYLKLRESIDLYTLTDSINAGAGVNFDGRTFVGIANATTTQDLFGTSNTFQGGQIGTRIGIPVGAGSIAIKANVAMGMTHQILDVSGQSTLLQPNLPTRTLPGGNQAVPSNSGHFTHNKLSIVPETAINFDYPLITNVHFLIGYNFLYWTGVARPGEQISRTIDTRQVPTDFNFRPGFQATVPAPGIHSTDFFTYGMNVGLALTF